MWFACKAASLRKEDNYNLANIPKSVQGRIEPVNRLAINRLVSQRQLRGFRRFMIRSYME